MLLTELLITIIVVN